MHNTSNIIRKIRFYPDCFFFMLDKWLKKMSQKGYHLIDYGIFTYTFEKGRPADKEYFTYSCDRTGDGWFSISLRYPNLKKTYGKKRKKSKLNKANISIGVTIVEIDTDRISISDIGYKELIKDRNRLYFFRAVRDVTLVLVMLLILIVVQILEMHN